MKLLWINNIAIPQIAKAAGVPSVPVGGWMVKLADELSERDGINLKIMFPYAVELDGKAGKIDFSSFQINPRKVKINHLGGQEQRIRKVIEEYQPDVVHIFGTEYEHSYVTVKVCEELGILDKVAVSIQGLVSIYSKHYYAYLEPKIIYGRTLRDIYKGNVADGKRMLQKSGEFEVETLKTVHHIIGRTEWDKACTGLINPKAVYHFNNEMLREAFYENRWNLETCEKHSIFMSQATLPLKGIHTALEALKILKIFYPDVKIYIAGKSYQAKSRWKLSYYEKYILKYIEKNDLKKQVEFVGFLDENNMCRQYLKAHVFVSASSIENSPNSVCEAMMLGVPVVSSMAGGVDSLITQEENGFYFQADAPYMLAHYIKKIFEDDSLANMISERARETAQKRHNVEEIIRGLMEIYQSIAGKLGG